MSHYTEERIRAMVDATNIAGRHANTISEQLRAIFLPLVGSKVTKTGGELIEKINKKIPEFPNTFDCRILFNYQQYQKAICGYSLAWNVYIKVPFLNNDKNDFKSYEECSLHCSIGYVDKQILTEVYPVREYPTNYCADELIKNLADYDEKRQIIREARGKTRPVWAGIAK